LLICHNYTAQHFAVNTQNARVGQFLGIDLKPMPCYTYGMESPKKRGRPKKECSEKNKPRQLGRWSDNEWQALRDAAAKKGLAVATWARPILLAAAGRRKRRTQNRQPN